MYDPAVGRWNGVDALADSYSSISPYTYVYNNPNSYTDPTGNSAVGIINEKKKTVTIKATIYVSGEGATSKLAKAGAQQVQSDWNAAGGSISINGTSYDVRFKVKGKRVSGKRAERIARRDGRIRGNNPVSRSATRTYKNNFVVLSDQYESAYTDALNNPSESGVRGGNFYTMPSSDFLSSMSHEFGHGMGWFDAGQVGKPTEGIVNPNDPKVLQRIGVIPPDPYLNGFHDLMGNLDQNGLRVPGIMTPDIPADDMQRFGNLLGATAPLNSSLIRNGSYSSGSAVPADVNKTSYSLNAGLIRAGFTTASKKNNLIILKNAK